MLKKYSYCQFRGTDAEWQISDLDLQRVNLVVGPNATGKSKLLGSIWNFARVVSKPSINFMEAEWSVAFEEAETDKTINVELHIHDNQVHKEEVVKDGRTCLIRHADGRGTIEIEIEHERKNVQFQVEEHQVAISSKRDFVMHPFLEPVHDWASKVIYIPFGTPMGRNSLLISNHPLSTKRYSIDQVLRHDDLHERATELFKLAFSMYSEEYSSLVAEYMRRVGFDVSKVCTTNYEGNIPFRNPVPPEILQVFESNLQIAINQQDISQGMFRCLATCIFLAYASLSDRSFVLIVDGVGEGLDYQRSQSLIDLLLDVASKRSVQLIMASNDHFVLNKVPLTSWVILRRNGMHITKYTSQTHKEEFARFRRLGLRNTDLFKMGII